MTPDEAVKAARDFLEASTRLAAAKAAALKAQAELATAKDAVDRAELPLRALVCAANPGALIDTGFWNGRTGERSMVLIEYRRSEAPLVTHMSAIGQK